MRQSRPTRPIGLTWLPLLSLLSLLAVTMGCAPKTSRDLFLAIHQRKIQPDAVMIHAQKSQARLDGALANMMWVGGSWCDAKLVAALIAKGANPNATIITDRAGGTTTEAGHPICNTAMSLGLAP